MLLPQAGAPGRVGVAPWRGFAHEFHGEAGVRRMVSVELVAGQGPELPRRRRVGVFLEVTTGEFEAGRVVFLGLRERDAVRGIRGDAQAEAVGHDAFLAFLLPAGADRTDEGQGESVAVEAVDGELRPEVLAAGQGLGELIAAFASEAPVDAGLRHEVSLVGGVDEDLGGVPPARGRDPGEAGVFLLHFDQRLFGEHGHAGFRQHGLGDPRGDVGFVSPDGGVGRGEVIWELHAARGVVGGDAAVPFREESAQGAPDGMMGVAAAEAAGVEPADVGGGLDEDDFGAFPGRRDGRAEASGGRPVHDDVGLGRRGALGAADRVGRQEQRAGAEGAEEEWQTHRVDQRTL